MPEPSANFKLEPVLEDRTLNRGLIGRELLEIVLSLVVNDVALIGIGSFGLARMALVEGKTPSPSLDNSACKQKTCRKAGLLLTF